MRRKSIIQISVIAALSLVFLVSCASVPELATRDIPAGNNGVGGENENTNAGSGEYKVGTLSYQQPPASLQINKLDILFVVDTSGSLDQERQAISNGLAGFLDSLPVEANVRVGVMLAHIRTDNPATTQVEGWSGRLFQSSRGEPLVLDTTTMSRSTLLGYFDNKMRFPVGETISDGGEALLYSVTRSLDAERKTIIQNQGFYRNDAALAVVWVTDENDICSRYLPNINFVPDGERRPDGTTYEQYAYDNFCVDANGTPIVTHTSVWNGLRALKGTLPILNAGLIYTDEQTVPPGAENEVGYGIRELVMLSQGVFVDMAVPEDIPEGLETVGRYTTTVLQNLRRNFELPNVAIDPQSISANVDGTAVNFTYDAATRVVTIASPGNPGSIVLITYAYLE